MRSTMRSPQHDDSCSAVKRWRAKMTISSRLSQACGALAVGLPLFVLSQLAPAAHAQAPAHHASGFGNSGVLRPRAAAGASAIRLPGGSSQSISWQPVSVERDKGINVAAGIAAIPSKYQHWKMRPCRRHGSLQALAREATPRCDGDTVCDGDRSCDAAGHAWTDREGLSRPIRLPPRYTAVWLSNRIPLTKQVAAGSIDSDSSRSKGGFLP